MPARQQPDRTGAEAYQRLRHERAEAVVAYARRIGQQKQVSTNRVAMAVRDLMLPFFLRRAASDTTQNWLYDYRLEWDRTLTATTAAAELSGPR